MNIAIIRILNLVIAVLTAMVNKLTVSQVDLEFEAIDVELEFETVVSGQLDFFDVLDNPVEIVAEVETTSVVETEEVVTEVQFDCSSIIAALGLVTEAPVVETVEEVAVEVETVTVLGIEYAIRHMTNVDVSFSGRSISRFNNVEGYLFEGSNGTSDFLIRVQAPLSLSNAKEWMSRNNDARYFTTKVVVTPTVTKFI